MAVTAGILPFLSYFDRDKLPLANGKIFFFDQTSRVAKEVFQDPAGQVPYPQPVPLDSAGRLGQVFYEDDAPYFIEIRDSDDALIDTIPNFVAPGDGSGPPVTVENDFDNIVINGQFRFFEQEEFTTVPTTLTKIAGDAFFFEKDGTGTDDTLKFLRFAIDATAPDATPIFFLEYDNPVPGVGETFADLTYEIDDVRSLQGENVTIFIGAADQSGNDRTIEFSIVQDFGTGGSPSATNVQNVTTFPLTSTFQDLSKNFTVDSTLGKTRGTNNDDKLILRFRLAPGFAGRISITDIYLKRGEPSTAYPWESFAETDSKLRALELPLGTKEEIGDSLSWEADQFNGPGELGFRENPFIGSILMAVQGTADLGWFTCNGQSLPKSGLPARLFAKIGFDVTAVSGFSSRTSSTNKIIFSADLLGTPVEAPVTPSPFSHVILAPGSSTTHFEVEITFPAGTALDIVPSTSAGITTYSAKEFTFATPTKRYRVVYVPDQNYFTAPVDQTHSLVIIRVSNADTATEVRDKTLAVMELLAPSGVASQDNFVSTVATDTVTNTSLTIGAPKTTADAGNSGFTVITTVAGSTTTYQEFTVKTLAATSLTAGNNFVCGTPNLDFAIYFIIDGQGLEPTGTFDFKIPLELDSATDGVNEVATKLKDLMDGLLYQVPDMQGLFVRGVGSGNSIDVYHDDPSSRNSFANLSTTAGTAQLNDIKDHPHEIGTDALSGAGSAQAVPVSGATTKKTTDRTGIIESRPNNINLFYYIKVF